MMQKEKDVHKVFRENSNNNGPQMRTHLEFAKNQMISSLESEPGHVRKKWEKQLGLMMSKWLGF